MITVKILKCEEHPEGSRESLCNHKGLSSEEESCVRMCEGGSKGQIERLADAMLLALRMEEC